MEVVLLPEAQTDQEFWMKSGNVKVQNKITKLVNAILENPFEGIGKPEALKYGLSRKWSRRITGEHRLIYEVVDNVLYIYSMRGHYK